MPVVVDTGILYAAADRHDAWHRRAATYLRRTRDLLIVPVTVVPEAAYLIQARLGDHVERRFIRSLAARELAIESLRDVDWQRAVDLMDQYDAIGFVDASVVAIAERLNVRTLATTDRRHFGSVRPKHCASFELVP